MDLVLGNSVGDPFPNGFSQRFKTYQKCVVTRKKMCNSSRIFSQELVTEGLESTLIRNLTDHLGNNLLHCVCSAGHTPLLPLLTSRLGNELTGALSDENRKGLTPVQIAIKVNYLQKYPAI